MSSDPNNGMLTKIWGTHLWESVHCITFGYPLKPSKDDIEHYKNFFISLQYVMPCKYCRQSYSEFIISEPTEITDAIFQSRETITKWAFELHERVNQKLGVTYGVSYENVCKRYEAFRAKCTPDAHGCIMPADLKACSYEIADKKDYPIISYDLAMCFKKYAEKRGVSFDKLNAYNTASQNIRSNDWNIRNLECAEIVKTMKIGGIASYEKEGEYKHLPSINELKLISKMSTTMSFEELYKIIEKLGYRVERVYKITSL
jgi:hypothetical protein